MSRPVRPTKLPEWATAVGADIVEPSLGQKQDGWDPDDRPPAGWVNWWKKNVYEWLLYYSDIQIRNWDKSADTTNIAYKEVAYDEETGLYLFCGSNTSTLDGILHAAKNPHNYRARTNSQISGEALLGIATNNGDIVCSGENGRLAYTVNGLWGSWGFHTEGTVDLNDVDFGDGYWVAPTEEGDVIVSDTSDPSGDWDSETTPASSANDALRCVKYIADWDRWILAGEQNGSISGLYTAEGGASPDTWTERTNPLADPSPAQRYPDNIAYNGSKAFITCTSGGGSIQLISTSDGITWADITTNLTVLDGIQTPATCFADPYGNLIVIGQNVWALSIDDGASFEVLGYGESDPPGKGGVYSAHGGAWAAITDGGRRWFSLRV